MKSALIILSAVVLVNMAAAQAVAPSGDKKDKPSAAERREKFYKKHGNLVVKPGSQQGKIAFINTQSDIALGEDFAKVVAVQARQTRLNVVLEQSAPGDPAALKENSRAAAAVIIVADDTTPAILAAIEDGWAVVNVRKLAVGLNSDSAKAKFWVGRCHKEALRAMAAVSGGLTSQYPDNVMDTTSIPELDHCDSVYPMDVIQKMRKFLATRGVTMVQMTTYYQACVQGWAPAPTNDVQKAIWDKVHELPTKPIVIEPESKTQKK